MLIVFGSIYLDYSFTIDHLPEPGETVISPRYDTAPSGRGANQSLAAARMGAKTAIIGKVGDDGMGQRVLANLRRYEVMTSGVAKSEDLPTGMASVIKTPKGDNAIIVASGANATVKADQVPDEILHEDNVVLMQMELPLLENMDVMRRAKNNGAKVILNLAPAVKVSAEALSCINVLIVNQVEARHLSQALGLPGDIDKTKLAQALSQLGKLDCIITSGQDGVVAATKDGAVWIAQSMKIENPVDTSGASDCFCGTFAALIHEGRDFADALHYAIVASGLSCMKEGTQDSYPYSSDVEENLDAVPRPQKQ